MVGGKFNKIITAHIIIQNPLANIQTPHKHRRTDFECLQEVKKKHSNRKTRNTIGVKTFYVVPVENVPNEQSQTWSSPKKRREMPAAIVLPSTLSACGDPFPCSCSHVSLRTLFHYIHSLNQPVSLSHHPLENVAFPSSGESSGVCPCKPAPS